MPTTEQGVPGVRQFSGYINEEWDRRLRTIRNRRDTYQQMQDDPTIAASLRGIDALARSSEWTLDPADDAPPEVLEHVQDCMNAMEGSWGDKLSEILSEIVYGFSLFEIVYVNRPDGMIGWKRWAPRGQETIERWEFDEAGRDWLAAVQVNPNTGKTFTIERDRLLHFVTVSRKQSPEGQSLIRGAFDPWYMKKHIQRIEGIGIERDMSGVPMLKIPTADYNNATKQAAWLDVLSALRVNEAAGLLFPSDVDPTSGAALYDFSLVSTGGSRPIDTDKIVDRYTRAIMRNLLIDWLMLGDEGGGSFALGVSKAEIFASFVQSILDSIADTITEQAIKPLCRYNGWTDEQAPTFRFERVQRKDVAMYADALVKLASGQLIEAGKAEVQTFVYELIGLPIPDEGFEDREVAQKVVVMPGQESPTADDTTDDAGADEQVVEGAAKDKQFTEPLTSDLLAESREVFRKTVGDKLAGLIDANVEAA